MCHGTKISYIHVSVKNQWGRRQLQHFFSKKKNRTILIFSERANLDVMFLAAINSCTWLLFGFWLLTLKCVSPGFCAEDGEVDVGLPAVDDGVRLLARPLRSLLRRHDHLKTRVKDIMLTTRHSPYFRKAFVRFYEFMIHATFPLSRLVIWSPSAANRRAPLKLCTFGIDQNVRRSQGG